MGGPDQEHRLRLEGAIVNDEIDLRSFTIDGQTHTVNLIIPPVAAPGAFNHLAAAVQVDGNAFETPYSLFIDKVKFVRWPALLTLVSPADGSVASHDRPTLTWTAIPGSSRYELQLDTVNPPVAAVVRTASTSYTPPDSLCLTEYYWRVRAVDSAGHASPWTRTWQVGVETSSVTTIPRLNVVTTHTPTLTWNPITWATQYEIQVDDSPTFTPPLEYGNVVSASNLSDTTLPLYGCTHYWRVRAQRSSGSWGAWGAVESFVINAP